MPPGFPDARHGGGSAARDVLVSLLPGALILAIGLTAGAASAQLPGPEQPMLPWPGPAPAQRPAPSPDAPQTRSGSGELEPGNPPSVPGGRALPPRPPEADTAPPSGRSATEAVPSIPSPRALPRELVLDRRRRQLLVLEAGRPLRRFTVAVGMPGWETPVGRFRVIEMTSDPIWEHPISGLRIPPGPQNPLGSRWIGFHRDCDRQRGAQGGGLMQLRGCVAAGFHGTPNRTSIGRAVSHGCVRLYDEDVRSLFELVQLGTPVTVLP